MKKLQIFYGVLCIVTGIVLLIAFFGKPSTVEVTPETRTEIVSTNYFTNEQIEEAMKVSKDYFYKEFKKCDLSKITYKDETEAMELELLFIPQKGSDKKFNKNQEYRTLFHLELEDDKWVVKSYE